MYFTPQHQLEAGLEGQDQRKLTQSQSSANTRPLEAQQKKRQVVFICGWGNDLTHWAIQVKVHAAAPMAHRRGSKPEKPSGCENCDVVIYQNLNRAFWAQVGSWRRYFSFFYGIVKVEEVKVFTSLCLCTSSAEYLVLVPNLLSTKRLVRYPFRALGL